MAKLDGKAFALSVALGALLTAPAAASFEDKARSNKRADDGSRRVCRALTLTGTRFTTRVCRTQAEWDLEMSKSQDSALRHQRDNSAASENRGPS